MNSLSYHKKLAGKIEVVSRATIESKDDLALAYTPGVAEACLEIAKDPEKVYDYTRKHNMVAVITDGSAVLGLGNIGAQASLPVMEGKAILFKTFADVDAFPLALATQDPQEIIETVIRIAPMFGGINLEDIAAPHCFEIEQTLSERLDIPVFHDDQHGTAIVTLAGIYNALRITNKKLEEIHIVISGVGAAGVAITKLLFEAGARHIILVDSQGIIVSGRAGLNSIKEELATLTNTQKREGSLSDALRGADLFIGVSKGGVLSEEMIRSMNNEPIIFAMANPDPEILPEAAKRAGAKVIATGRSDFPNQINNVLVFPGFFRGLLNARIKNITTQMKLRAAKALAQMVEDPDEEYIVPDALDKNVAAVIAQAVQEK